MLKLQKTVNHFGTAIAWVSLIGYTLIILVTFCDAFMTKLFSIPIPGAYEIVERLMIVAVFASFTYGQTQKTHITMTILIMHLPQKLRMVIFALMSYISVFTAAYLAYAAYLQVGQSLKQAYQTAVLHIPYWPFYLLEGIGMTLFAIVLLYDAILSTAAIFSQKYYDAVTATWE